MLSGILFGLLGILVFLFLFWRKLREDYTSSAVFTTAIYIFLGVGSGVLISFKFWPIFWFWLGLLGAGIGFSVGILRYKMRFFESLDATLFSVFPGLSLVFLSDAISKQRLSSFIGALLILAFSALYFYLDKNYKNFVWYKSGRVGFSGLTTAGTFFLVRSILAIFFPLVLSFSGKFETMFSGIMAFVCFLLIFTLNRKI